jgi:acyl-CoA synthetase (AMP-forming)/AMP-acid ligase II/thioesterase domain-containing protein
LLLCDGLAVLAAKRPHDIAVAAPDRKPLTFEQLSAQVASVASTLTDAGISRRDRVVLLVRDGPEAVVASLGVVTSAVCAPLNARCSADELDEHFTALKPAALITTVGAESFARRIAARHGAAVLELMPCVDQPAGSFTLRTTDRVTPLRQPIGNADDVALILLTSGTTSRSKLVPLTHANVMATVERVQAALQLSPADRYLNVSPLFYSQGIMLTFSAMLSGSSVVCPPGFQSAQFLHWFDAHRPTWYSAAPAVHQAILAQSRGKPRDIRHHLRFIRSAAAPLSRSLREQLEGFFDAPVIESYGMTECYPISANPLPPCERKPGSAGVAAATEIAIYDPVNGFVGPERTGEIVVRGPHVTSGYLNHPPGQSSNFVDDWFRTGDLGHLDRDGFLFVTGRINDLVNRGGEKISPAEVDEVLRAHPDIQDASAFPVPHPTLGEDIAAAIVLREQTSPSSDEIQRFARQHLSEFKVPRDIVFVRELPNSTTGKVQRRILTEQFGRRANGRMSQPMMAALSPVQRRLIQIWSDLLETQSVGPFDNFFDLGGNSLLAAQLVAQVERFWGRRFSLQAFLHEPTIEALARLVTGERTNEAPHVLLPVQPHGSRPPFFWVHGDTSTRFLPRYLKPDQPVYGLEHQSQDGTSARYTTVESIASYYLGEMLKIQPIGPYSLGGFSFGGTLAFEMAQQLKNRGEEVSLLVMLDSHFPGPDVHDPAAPSSNGVGVARHLQTLATISPSEGVSYVVVRIRSRLGQKLATVTSKFKAAYCEMLRKVGRPIPPTLLSRYLLRLYVEARRAYRPQKYSGKVMYIKCERRSNYHRAMWEQLVVGGVSCYEIPGGHLDAISTSYGHLWAECLNGWLDAARQSPSSSRIAAVDCGSVNQEIDDSRRYQDR